MEKIKFVDFKALNLIDENMKANVPQQVKSIREQIIGDVGSENKQNEEMSQDLKEM